MTDPFLAEIRIFAGNFAPRGWALCQGQLMPISQNTALFSLLGTNYGGDGKSTFALPNLEGAAPMQQGQGPGLSYRQLGSQGGSPTTTLLAEHLPAHTHTVRAVDAAGTKTSPAGAMFGQGRNGRSATRTYSTAAPNLAMSPLAAAEAGGGQPHNNMPPYLVVGFIIALEGIYPPRP